LASSPGHGQDYPSKTVTIVVPLAAGTGMDVVARLYGEQLAQGLGKPVIVENRPGAGMLVAAQSITTAPADGHMLLAATPTLLSVNQTVFKHLPYDPEKDLTPIAHYLASPFVLVVNPSLPVQTVPEFLKYAKERPTPLSYSTPAGGGVPHFAVELIKQRYDLQLTHVPYRNSPQSILDVAAGHVNFAFAEAGASLPLIRDGKLRARPRGVVETAAAGASERSDLRRGGGNSRLRIGGLAHVGGAFRHAGAGARPPARRDEAHHVSAGNETAHRQHGADPARSAADRGDRALSPRGDGQMGRGAQGDRACRFAMTSRAATGAIRPAARSGWSHWAAFPATRPTR
jgi:hypothetical protein